MWLLIAREDCKLCTILVTIVLNRIKSFFYHFTAIGKDQEHQIWWFHSHGFHHTHKFHQYCLNVFQKQTLLYFVINHSFFFMNIFCNTLGFMGVYHNHQMVLFLPTRNTKTLRKLVRGEKMAA